MVHPSCGCAGVFTAHAAIELYAEAFDEAGALDKLPPSVRAMAETMVREQRLQRILRDRGGGFAEKYEQLVSERYAAIMSEERLNADDKFVVQEANRRARDAVQHVKAQFETRLEASRKSYESQLGQMRDELRQERSEIAPHHFCAVREEAVGVLREFRRVQL